jgi:photosystem II stability/assembly factor-like uncharacterized protein
MRPVRIAAAVALTVAAAVTGSFVVRSTSHRSTTPGIGVAAPAPPNTAANPAPPTSVTVDPGQNHPGPAPRPPGPTKLPLGRVGALEAVQAVGTQIAFAAGKGAILTTSDGGRTWVRVWRGPQDLRYLDFVSASTGWVVGDGILLGTVDGGQHWHQLGQPRVRPLRSVHFSSPSEGWGIAGGSDRPVEGSIPATTLVHTRDGGRTWSALAAPAPPQSVCFTSPNDGWLASGIRVWRSTDGGRSWASQANFVPRLRQYTYAPSAWLQCAATGAAWVRFDSNEGAAGSSPYALYATGDGGAHWRGVLAWHGEQGVPPGPGTYPGPFSVIDPQRAFLLSPTPAADSTGAVLISRGGSLLRRLPGIPRTRLSTVSEPMSVSFASATRGWVVGTDPAGRGVILATLDGGQSWRSQLPT